MNKYVGTYAMPNGTFFKVFETETGKLIDQNGIVITQSELNDYRRIDADEKCYLVSGIISSKNMTRAEAEEAKRKLEKDLEKNGFFADLGIEE